MRQNRKIVTYQRNKRKIINDPVYGFITIPGDFIFDLIEHPWFQRLRDIKQLGLTSFVYPGGVHTRFQHSLGALHLTCMAIQTLREKGVKITVEEEEGIYIAILLHDIGHAPFSHALEGIFTYNSTHEDITLTIMTLLNNIYDGRLNIAIDIFTDRYPRKFLHELISGQIDMDRMDYLRRDSFYTGVIEGTVGSDRIIRMLNVIDDMLVIEEKGIYSIEKLLVARRLMYWQVYMHKTVLSSERILERMIRRVRELVINDNDIFLTPAMKFFLTNEITYNNVTNQWNVAPEVMVDYFTGISDADILTAAKYWTKNNDNILSDLSSRILQRRLFAIEMQDEPFSSKMIEEKRMSVIKKYQLDESLTNYYLFTDTVYHRVYSPGSLDVKVLLKNGEVKSVSDVSDMFNHDNLSTKKTKYYLCYPK